MPFKLRTIQQFPGPRFLMDESVFRTREGKSRNIPYGRGALRKKNDGSSNDNHYDYGRQILKDKPLGTNQNQGFTTAAPKRLAFSYVKILGWSSIHKKLRSGAGGWCMVW